MEILNQAIRKSDWTQCRRQLGQITLQLKQQGEGSAPAAENLTLLRDLLAKTLEFGVVTQLSHSPRLAEKAQQLATAVRDANSAASLRDVASGLKSLWVGIEMQAPDVQQQQEMLKRILLLLVENIGELLDDDTWLRGQLDMVQEVIAGPLQDPVAAGGGKTAQGRHLQAKHGQARPARSHRHAQGHHDHVRQPHERRRGGQ